MSFLGRAILVVWQHWTPEMFCAVARGLGVLFFFYFIRTSHNTGILPLLFPVENSRVLPQIQKKIIGKQTHHGSERS